MVPDDIWLPAGLRFAILCSVLENAPYDSLPYPRRPLDRGTGEGFVIGILRRISVNIYVVGLRRSGKDTVARFLAAQQPGSRLIALTDPLYDIGQRYFGMEGKDRALLQKLGDAFRAIDEDFLPKHLLRLATEENTPVLCADIRLPREAGVLRAAGWLGIRVDRPEAARQQAVLEAGEHLSGPTAQHHTEQRVLEVPVDVVIANDGSLEDLQAATQMVWLRLQSQQQYFSVLSLT